MPYIDSSGNIVESRTSIFQLISGFFFFIICFIKSLFGPFLGSSKVSEPRGPSGRGGDGGGGYRRWPGSGGPGGPSSGGGGFNQRRPIGRLPRGAGMSCPPIGGGG